MKYTKEQRLDIGRRIYDGEISRYEAAEEYVINEQTARNYMRMYRDANQLPPKQGRRSICAPSFKKAPAELDELKANDKGRTYPGTNQGQDNRGTAKKKATR